MPTRPPFVILRLTVPRMGSPERKRGRAEAELIRAVQSRLYGLEVDGLYGCATAEAVQSWQWRAGSSNITGAITPAELAVLLGYTPRSRAWKALTGYRLEAPGRFRPIPVDKRVSCSEGAGGITLIPRSAVGLRAPRGVETVPYGPGTPMVLHWQGDGFGAMGLEASFAQIRGWQSYHMDTHGWLDIGYNLAVPRGVPVGTVIELRGIGVRGAHCGSNVGNAYPGVVVMTGAKDSGPTADQVTTLELLRDAIKHGRRTGHLEWSPTSCPGPVLWPWVQAHR